MLKPEPSTLPTEGCATTVLPSGDCYQGTVRGGRRHGRGRHTWVARRERYDGEWLRGMRHGAGCHVWSDGSRYAGVGLRV
jgi:hypothetical protein